MVNSGAGGLLHAEDAAEERALQEQPRRHVHRRDRQGRRRRRQAVRHGRAPSATTTTTATRTSSSPRTAAARSTTTTATARSPTSPRRPGSPRRAGRRAPSGSTTTTTASSICSSAASSSSRSKSNVFCGDNKLGQALLLHPARLQADAEPAVPQQRRRHVHARSAPAPTSQRALGKALGVVATDINNDGLMDLFVANDTVQNFLFANRGKGKWEEIGLPAEVGFSANGTAALGHGRGRRRLRRRRLAGPVRRQRRPGDVLALPERRQRVLLRRRRTPTASRRRRGC